ncbi:putative outer membrane protein [Bacteroides fragilis str. S38L5]|uniref:RagB/SusD family nutrient uptake outer membrane protein n=1 Tax=Bacteroides fragilis TaxID=817 RepID=UPI000446F9DE|nr:RagB/SusD family nutrient uptake outer membrane protein [Bacteroides fragilis]EYA96386.1 putative outer membrane protein [Bacteroides fragilis str. S38L5]EYB14975.1 putative outer membrane protein [Bacteroides fragilis str. S38L3]
MKRIKSTILYGLLVASSGLLVTSCADKLDLSPIDYYGSGSYWKTEAQATAYIDGIHKHLRDAAWQHTITFGELRGGRFITGASSDGMGVSNGDIILQNFDETHTGVSKFGDLFGRITNLNLFIARVTDATYLSDEMKNFYLGEVYGLRAFYYFDLYRIYGGGPLRLTADVVEGVIDPNKLYMARSTPKEVMTQIKSDLNKSMEYFGNMNDFDPYKRGKKVYWSKAATECLMGEVYLWTSKVTTGDDVANPADLTIAKTHLESVLNNYNLKMLDDFSQVFNAKNKANDEIIFAIRFLEGEATNSNGTFTYNVGTGSTKNRYQANGEVFGDALDIQNTGNQTYEYNKAVYQNFDDADTRKEATFIASYNKDGKTGELSLYGTHVRKNIGYVNAQGARVYCGDYIFYRLPWVYLTLAEIANMEGDNAAVAKYINLVRKRAYGNAWDETLYAYPETTDFTTNELAILHEKDKEFIQEGQRWWDLRRMTLTKGGTPLVFCKEGSLLGDAPILNKSTEAHKLLWPIEKTMLDKDPALEQTPGYK